MKGVCLAGMILWCLLTSSIAKGDEKSWHLEGVGKVFIKQSEGRRDLVCSDDELFNADIGRLQQALIRFLWSLFFPSSPHSITFAI